MPRRRRKNEEGALLIILMVGVAVSMVGLAVAFQTWSTIWRRDNEEELIFRGKQYVEAIRAYRTEQGKFPLNLEELMKPGPRQVRYIRKLFPDPMKKKAKWGLLYVVPGGRAIYDPVAAEKSKKSKADDGWGTPRADGLATASEGGDGFTQVTSDQNGTGVQNPGMGGQVGVNPQGGMPPGVQGFGGPKGNPMRGAMAMPAIAPPPMPPPNSDDEKAVSEPPIGWGIAGVISRVVVTSGGASGAEGDGEAPPTTADSGTPSTFKVFKGHEHSNEWQFHVFDNSPELADAPQGATGRGSNPTFLGPGFGGQGPISGVGGGNRPQGFGGMGGNMGNQAVPGGGRQQNPGWAPSPGKGNRNQ